MLDESGWEDIVRLAIEEEREYLDELLPKFIVTHFGKYLVSRVDTREYWIVNTEPEAQELAVDETYKEPRPTVGTVGYTRIDALSMRELLPN
jgi:hypothetical protein